MSKANILGRAWFYDELPTRIELWEHELEPMEGLKRSGADWAHSFFAECQTDDSLREMFELPAEGNFQVLFKGVMESWRTGGYEYPEEYDEDFTVEECKHVPIPDEWVKEQKQWAAELDERAKD